MKRILISVLLLVFAATVFSACNKVSDKTTTVINTTAPFTTAVQITETETTDETTLISETTTLIYSETTLPRPVVSTTGVPTTAVTTASGRVYTEETVEEDIRYGVKVHLYRTTQYQLVNGERVDVSSEYTDVTVNRLLYDAEYEDLLPAARQNRDTYRAYIEEVLRIVNGYRAAEGIAPLTLNEDLTEMSCVRAEEMAWSGNHNHPGNRRFKALFEAAGFESGLAGENLGWGYDTPQAVCEAWKNSPGHYENIMNPGFTQIGIGVAADADPRSKLCWTQHFHEGK